MHTYLKALLMVAAVAGLYVPATANADFRDYNYKAWAHRGGSSSSRSGMRSRPMYRSAAPVIVRTEPAPSVVAQAPTEQRSFSYEPSQQAETTTPCPPSRVIVKPAPETAQRPMQTERSFSYEPAIEPSVRTYSAPRMQSSRPSRSSATPRFLLPKTDPRKYRN